MRDGLIQSAISMRAALADPLLLGSVFSGESWRTWRAVLIAAMGEQLTDDELSVFGTVTGRESSPDQRIEEALFLIGRRGGKDKAASGLATYLAALVDWRPVLSRGERGLVLCIGADQRQAKVTRDYIEGIFDSSPLLSQLVTNRTADAIELDNQIAIEVRAANFRRLRGVTAVAIIATEAAFWYSDETSGNPDSEILAAVRPALSTTGGPLIIITTPYARRGEVWDLYRRHYGAEGDPGILVVQGSSRDFNPTLPQRVIDRALERDHAAASAEYLAQFRTDIERLFTRESVEACVAVGERERAPLPNIKYFGFVDPSGGSADSMTLAIGHRADDVALLDAVREVKPPFSPQAVVDEFAALLKSYHLKSVTGDRYAGEWPREQFRNLGIEYKVAEKTRSDLYRDLLPVVNSGRVDLLDHDRLTAQLIGLERRTARSGKDSIDHAPGSHDDIANAVAGAVNLTVGYKGASAATIFTGFA